MVPLSGQVLALLLPHDTLVLQVALVPHQDHRYLVKNQHSDITHETDMTKVQTVRKDMYTILTCKKWLRCMRELLFRDR